MSKKQRTEAQIQKMFKATFSTPAGKECLEYLNEIFVNREVYKQSITFEQTAFREGQRDVIRQMNKQVVKDV